MLYQTKDLNQIKETIEKIFKDESNKQLDIFLSLSEHKLKNLRLCLSKILNLKYPQKHKRLLGNLSKAMPDPIFKKLLSELKDMEKVKLAVEFEGLEAARIEDTVKLRETDLNFTKHTAAIYNQKENRYYWVPIEKHLESHLKRFIKNNLDKIRSHNDFVFFSDSKKSHISKDWLRNKIRKVLAKLKLNKVYSKSRDGRNLNLYSSHSLRGHGATRIYKLAGNDIEIASQLLDHKDIKTTSLYIERDKEKLFEKMRCV